MISKAELNYIRVEIFKSIIKKYSFKCKPVSSGELLEGFLSGERKDLNVDRDLQLCEKFASGKQMVLYEDVQQFCLQMQKELTFKGLKKEDGIEMKKEIEEAADIFNQLYDNKISAGAVYSKYDIKKYDALKDKIADILLNK